MPFRKNKRVSLKIDKTGIAHVELTRPEKMNAIDPEMYARMDDVGTSLAAEKGLKAVIISGQGKSFCSGLDVATIAGISELLANHLTTRTHGNCNLFQKIVMQWRKLPVPVITVIQGACFGAGLQIASSADIRITTADARFSIMEMKWGIIPDMGGYALWRENVRSDVMRELMYTNREFSGEEAVRFGFATEVAADPLARAKELAEIITRRNPHAIRAAKRLANSAHDEDTDTLLMEESREQQALLMSVNQREAVEAQLAKRPPRFEDVEPH